MDGSRRNTVDGSRTKSRRNTVNKIRSKSRKE